MKVFILYAHNEPKSFNGAMLNIAVDALERSGHTVKVSDLYSQGFNPVAGRHDFLSTGDHEVFKYSREQSEAAKYGSFSNDILIEQEKLFWCDLFIVQFPLWWYGFPAILKGWFDRVFTKGNTYDDGLIYDRGAFAGKKALISMTTGGTPNPTVSNEDVRNFLYHFNHGILYFLGFTVLDPFIIFSPASMAKIEREYRLDEYKKFILDIDNAPECAFEKISERGFSYNLLCSSTPAKDNSPNKEFALT